jgi:hypothetical protein
MCEPKVGGHAGPPLQWVVFQGEINIRVAKEARMQGGEFKGRGSEISNRYQGLRPSGLEPYRPG